MTPNSHYNSKFIICSDTNCCHYYICLELCTLILQKKSLICGHSNSFFLKCSRPPCRCYAIQSLQFQRKQTLILKIEVSNHHLGTAKLSYNWVDGVIRDITCPGLYMALTNWLQILTHFFLPSVFFVGLLINFYFKTDSYRKGVIHSAVARMG